MILAVDVDYKEIHASIAGVLFENWGDGIEKSHCSSIVRDVHDYISGQFYKRELPCILTLIREHNLTPTCIIIDGYVYLDGVGTPGLGRYLFDALKAKVAVIGVAKKPYIDVTRKGEIYRGCSKKPLYVSCEGMEFEQARQLVISMHGKFRIPTLLKKVDQLCRQIQN